MLHRTFSAVGGPALRAVFVSVAVPVLLLRGRWRSAAMLVSATGGMGIINTTLKEVVRRQRPPGLPGLKQAGGYSFPSGHSSGSLVFFGAAGYLIWHTTRHRILTTGSFVVASLIVWLVGRSRVSLRAHHLSDVVAGYAIGGVWLCMILKLFAKPLALETEPASRT